jgi:signal transduction histidine kinase
LHRFYASSDNQALPRKRFQSPTTRLITGLAIMLTIVAAFCLYTLSQIAGLRQLQNQTIDRNRKDSLQLLRMQNDLGGLGLAMRDMLNGDEPYPLYAWAAQFERIRKDLDDAIRLDAMLAPMAGDPERKAYFIRSLAQFWTSADRMFDLARRGEEKPARDLVLTSLEAQQATLVSAVSRLLVENNETQQRVAGQVATIYDRVENQIYAFFVLALVTIAVAGLLLIRSNRTVLHRIAHLSEQRSALARRLITMQEEMFRSISRELHDEFGQLLTAIGTMLMRARRHRLPPSLSEDLDEIRNTAQEALEKTRSLTQALHPAILDDAGLEEAIGWYLSVFERQTGIHVDLEKSGLSRELGEDRPIHVYRVLQEALNNLARHSRSISAWVRVRFLADRLELEVEDRGVGLDYETKESRGMGMIGMRERAALLSGRIQFLRPEQGGTLVKLDVPLEPGRVLND